MQFKLQSKIPVIGDTFLEIKYDVTMIGGFYNIRWEQWQIISMLDKDTFLIKNPDTDKWGTDSTTAKRNVIVCDGF